ncbi:MAG: GNAT family N-acetyltransferase [Betaproteobacteria bacterium]|nr:GNAT family N-acetyltransferase [Betaproteobacteria bacterium]
METHTKDSSPLTLVPATTDAEIGAIRKLLREYQQSLDTDLCFQNFEQEVASLPGDYVPPRGRLLLGYANGLAAGCIAMRGLNADTAEMKRLFVRPDYRGCGFGRAFAQAIIDAARGEGYRRLVLDTLPSMGDAQALYAVLGFRDIAAYTNNPVAGTRFMGLDLAPLESA